VTLAGVLIVGGGSVYGAQMAPPLSSVVRHWVKVQVSTKQHYIPLLGLLAEYIFRFVGWFSNILRSDHKLPGGGN